MEIRFNFDLPKAMQALCFLLERLGTLDKVKLMKLLYLSEREQFIRTGVPITGDRLVAMPLGPVPSMTLSAINGDLWETSSAVFKFIHLDDYSVELRASPGVDQLSEAELETLAAIADEHGKKGTWALVRETHRLAEYVESYVEGTSRTIPYERIAKHSGAESRFRLDRPVISAVTASLINCPFAPDPDL